MIKKILALGITIFIFSFSAVRAQDQLATWDLIGAGGSSSVAASNLGTGIQSATISFGPGLTPLVNSYMADGFVGVNQEAVTLADAISQPNGGEYISIVITPKPGYSIDIYHVNIALVSQNQTRNFDLLSNLKEFSAANAIGEFSKLNWSSLSSFVVSNHTNISNSVEFRVYMYTPSPGTANIYEAVGFGLNNGNDLIIEGAATNTATQNLAGTWSLQGNSIAATQFLGTTNNQDLSIYTNNAEKMRISANGNIGIGLPAGQSPGSTLEVTGTVKFNSFNGTGVNLINADQNGVLSRITTGTLGQTLTYGSNGPEWKDNVIQGQTTSVSTSNLITYDLFNSAPGSVNGQNTGSGWGGAWSGPGSISNTSPLVVPLPNSIDPTYLDVNGSVWRPTTTVVTSGQDTYEQTFGSAASPATCYSACSIFPCVDHHDGSVTCTFPNPPQRTDILNPNGNKQSETWLGFYVQSPDRNFYFTLSEGDNPTISGPSDYSKRSISIINFSIASSGGSSMEYWGLFQNTGTPNSAYIVSNTTTKALINTTYFIVAKFSSPQPGSFQMDLFVNPADATTEAPIATFMDPTFKFNSMLISGSAGTKVADIKFANSFNNLLPSRQGNQISSDLNVSGNITGGGNLSIAGNVGIGGAPVTNYKLKVTGGETWLQGNLLVTGTSVFSDHTTFSGGANFDRINLSGTMVLGTVPTNPQADYSGYMLAVNGKIVATQIVSSVNAWHDDVFEKDYKLLSLKNLEKYVTENKRLPDIPSEKEVLKKGIDLASMNALLLKKIEEMSLYVIDLEKRMKLLEERK